MSTAGMYEQRWQRDAHHVLGEFLKADGLPVIAWTIATSGALVGDVESLGSTPTKQRAAFAAWVQHIGADASPERTDSSGTAHLYAYFRRLDDRVRGAIRATIYPPADEVGAS